VADDTAAELEALRQERDAARAELEDLQGRTAAAADAAPLQAVALRDAQVRAAALQAGLQPDLAAALLDPTVDDRDLGSAMQRLARDYPEVRRDAPPPATEFVGGVEMPGDMPDSLRSLLFDKRGRPTPTRAARYAREHPEAYKVLRERDARDREDAGGNTVRVDFLDGLQRRNAGGPRKGQAG